MNNKTVAVIFSKDRPLQLSLCLKTYYICCEDHGKTDVFIIYKATNDRYEKAYAKLKKEYGGATFVLETDFKKDLTSILLTYQYCLFVVDDNVFVNKFKLNDAIDTIENDENIIGFSLRLGFNTKYCYSLNQNQQYSLHFKAKNGHKSIILFNWTKSTGDFAYPLELSSSLYKVGNIFSIVLLGNYNNPNSLEWVMYLSLPLFANKFFLLGSYEQSVAFCNPINKVQSVNENRWSNLKEYSPENLLQLFENGYKIDVNKFYGLIPNACHQEILFLEEK